MTGSSGRWVLGALLLAGLAHATAAGAAPREVADSGQAPTLFSVDAGPAEAPAMEIEAFSSAPSLEVEAFESAAAPDAGAAAPGVETFEVKGSTITARVFGTVRAEVAVDTRFDSPRGVDLAENVVEGRLRASLGADVKLSDRLRVVVEGRAQLRLAAQRELDRAKGFAEFLPGEVFVDLYTSRADLRVGYQRIALGANAGLAPADALNPRDLREGLLAGDPEDALLTTFAVRAVGEVKGVQWLVAYAPFFSPNRYVVFGQDEALLQPGLQQAVPTRRVDPSVEDFIQDRIFETQRPVPFAGDLALRLVSTGRVKVGASWVWMNEKLPQVVLDAELRTAMNQLQTDSGVDPAVAASLQNRFVAGETLNRGFYQRNHVFSAEASTLLGPGQLDVDVSFTPQQTYVNEQLLPVRKASVNWVLGYSQASDSPLVYAVNYVGLAVPGVAADERLLVLEPATARGAARVAWLHLFTGLIAYPVWKDRFELSLRAAFEPVQRSFAFSPRVTFQGVDKLKVYLTAEFYEGPALSPLGYFGRNDKVLLGVRYDLF